MRLLRVNSRRCGYFLLFICALSVPLALPLTACGTRRQDVAITYTRWPTSNTSFSMKVNLWYVLIALSMYTPPHVRRRTAHGGARLPNAVHYFSYFFFRWPLTGGIFRREYTSSTLKPTYSKTEAQRLPLWFAASDVRHLSACFAHPVGV